MGPTAKDTYTLHTLQFSHLLLDALTNSCQKWSGRRIYTRQSFGVFDTTLISGNKDKIGDFFLFLFFPFFLFFSFFSFLYLMCSFQLQLCLKLINPFFSFKPYRFQPRNKRTKGGKNSIKSVLPNATFFFLFARNEKKIRNVKYPFLLLL